MVWRGRGNGNVGDEKEWQRKCEREREEGGDNRRKAGRRNGEEIVQRRTD